MYIKNFTQYKNSEKIDEIFDGSPDAIAARERANKMTNREFLDYMGKPSDHNPTTKKQFWDDVELDRFNEKQRKLDIIENAKGKSFTIEDLQKAFDAEKKGTADWRGHKNARIINIDFATWYDNNFNK